MVIAESELEHCEQCGKSIASNEVKMCDECGQYCCDDCINANDLCDGCNEEYSTEI